MWIASAVLCIGLAGCESQPATFMPPNMITAPYDATMGDVLWAVVPPRNESGTSLVDANSVGDALVAAVTEIPGVTALPLNRTLEAMRALKIAGVDTPQQVRQLAEALGADAVLVGSITAWDPYNPPVIGLSMALFSRSGRLHREEGMLDPQALTSAATDAGFLAHSNFRDAPVSVASEHLDARNHQVKLFVKEYAQGRSDAGTALDWHIYFASMDLYTQFAAYHTVRRVMEGEWLRTSRVAAE
jgi:hypothetical protein